MQRIGFVLLVLFATSHRVNAQARTFTFVNQCSETVWVGALGNPGRLNPNGGGWAVAPGASGSVNLPPRWARRLWGRRGCHLDRQGFRTCAPRRLGGGPRM